ncbi:hypothetical protein L8T01_22945, partial [Enterobacter roggenkampii]|nr:hypothetical protein [Enterobacter roggenkampii]
AEFTIGEGELMAHDVPLGCAPDEYDDLISGTCSHLPYEKGIGASLFWIIWFPVVYWLLSLFTTLVSFPKVMLKRKRGRARWVSPDRGIGRIES